MAKCPKCGVEVSKPVKAWSMIRKPSKAGEIFLLTLGLYECTNCKRRFRDAVDKEKINIREIAQKVRVLEAEIVEATKRKAELEEKVKALEGEKACLLTEIEALKAIPELEAKATALDAEVAKLKEEKKALEEKAAPPPGETAPAEAPAEEKTCEQKPCE